MKKKRVVILLEYSSCIYSPLPRSLPEAATLAQSTRFLLILHCFTIQSDLGKDQGCLRLSIGPNSWRMASEGENAYEAILAPQVKPS